MFHQSDIVKLSVQTVEAEVVAKVTKLGLGIRSANGLHGHELGDELGDVLDGAIDIASFTSAIIAEATSD